MRCVTGHFEGVSELQIKKLLDDGVPTHSTACSIGKLHWHIATGVHPNVLQQRLQSGGFRVDFHFSHCKVPTPPHSTPPRPHPPDLTPLLKCFRQQAPRKTIRKLGVCTGLATGQGSSSSRKQKMKRMRNCSNLTRPAGIRYAYASHLWCASDFLLTWIFWWQIPWYSGDSSEPACYPFNNFWDAEDSTKTLRERTIQFYDDVHADSLINKDALVRSTTLCDMFDVQTL